MWRTWSKSRITGANRSGQRCLYLFDFKSLEWCVMPRLFDPLQLRDVTLPHRIAVSPMCMYSCEDGFANDWHLVHQGSRASGGAALVMTEATAVAPEGRISPGDMGLWKDAHIEPLARVTRFVSSQGSVPGIQLGHAGRKASCNVPWEGGAPLAAHAGAWKVCGPSPIPFTDGWPAPEELSIDGIRQVQKAFADAARRALEAGYRVLEVHAAHGYLIQEFLSPISNRRIDSYGGSFENRTRMLRETVEQVRAVWPERLPLFVRLSATEWTAESWTIEESVELARILAPLGVDLIDCSSGGNTAVFLAPLGSGYQVALAERVKREAGVLTGAVGMITSAAQADSIVMSGQADLVLLAREMLRDPYFPLHAARELGVNTRWPVQYLRAAPKDSLPRLKLT